MVCGVRRALEEKARDVAETVLCVVSSIRASCVHEGEAAARDTSDLTALLHDIGRSFESLLSQQAFDCAALVSSLTTTMAYFKYERARQSEIMISHNLANALSTPEEDILNVALLSKKPRKSRFMS